jgi:hypothetical protein
LSAGGNRGRRERRGKKLTRGSSSPAREGGRAGRQAGLRGKLGRGSAHAGEKRRELGLGLGKKERERERGLGRLAGLLSLPFLFLHSTNSNKTI